MGKPYTIVQRDKYKLAIYHGITPLDSDNDNVDVQVASVSLLSSLPLGILKP